MSCALLLTDFLSLSSSNPAFPSGAPHFHVFLAYECPGLAFDEIGWVGPKLYMLCIFRDFRIGQEKFNVRMNY